MKVELISIGDELLIGQTINTNAAWLGQELAMIGASVDKCTVIRDSREEILSNVDASLKNVDLVIVTGGLGPTRDDITKYTLCEYFETDLEINQEILEHIMAYFRDRNREMLDTNVQQAALPKDAKVLFNENGTAPGMWFEKNGKVLISLPGVPFEMKGIMKGEGFDRICDHFHLDSIYYRTVLTQGIGESFLAERIADIENEIRESGFGFAYLPSPGFVRLRITAAKNDKDASKIDEFIQQLTDRLPNYIYGYDGESLSGVVGQLLKDRNMTIGTVESCTGGSMARELVKISGSSDYFLGSFVTYSNKEKVKLVDVKQTDLDTVGAVSQEVVEQMAIGGRKKLEVDYCISTSGIAGPTGGTEDKPVGTVWIAIASENRVFSKKFRFGSDRIRNIDVAVSTALNLLRCEILGINS